MTVAAAPTPDVAHELEEFVRIHGPWALHNVHLGGGVYTMGPPRLLDVEGFKRIVQTVADLAGAPLDRLRVLDLGCGEGGLGIEFARHGARVLCVEGRAANLERARFVARVLGLSNLECRQDDVRNLSEAWGRFDVVLCVGLLYHLNEPDMLELLRAMASVCDRVAIVHTHVSLRAGAPLQWRGHEYHGCRVLEHLPGDAKEPAVLASLQNDHSYWLTRSSLVNALSDVGFTSVLDCRAPFITWQTGDHVTLAALRGTPVAIQAMPGFNDLPATRLPEQLRQERHPSQQWFYPIYRRAMRLLPQAAKEGFRHRLRRSGGFGLWWSRPDKDARR